MGLVSRLVNRMMAPLGYELRRVNRYVSPTMGNQPIPPGAKIYVGCGTDIREGYMGCDLRPLPHVGLVCKAWEVSHYTSEAEEIFTRHTLEHLTLAEASVALRDWYKSLRKGGKVHIIVPDLDFHISQWQRAEWSEATLKDKWSDGRWSLAGFFGWQNECNPEEASYNTIYWDVHKSGYNQRYLAFRLKEAGFQQVTTHIEDNCHLVGIGYK